MISIDIISDTVCPWCFIGKRRLEKAVAERPQFDYQIGWRPFQLNPDMPAGGMPRPQYLSLKFGGPERASKIYANIEAAGRSEELDFQFDAIRQQPNTFDSHRLIRWAAAAGVQDAVVEALFIRYFHEGADIGDRAVLTEIADACGMPAGEVAGNFANDVDVEEVKAEEMLARRMGINGVPCFIIDRKYAVSGAQDPSVLVNVFDLTTRETGAETTVAETPVAEATAAARPAPMAQAAEEAAGD